VEDGEHARGVSLRNTDGDTKNGFVFQYTLPLNLLPKEVFAQWMEIARRVADRPVPEATNTVDEDDRVDLPWWKCKKWAMHILQRVFERSVAWR